MFNAAILGQVAALAVLIGAGGDVNAAYKVRRVGLGSGMVGSDDEEVCLKGAECAGSKRMKGEWWVLARLAAFMTWW